MKLKENICPTLKEMLAWLETNGEKINKLVERMRNDNSDVCQELVSSGLLTPAQMYHAARQYELGKSREGKTVFWMIDERHRVCDGMVGDTWASVLLKQRDYLDKEWCPKHCLFGLHLLTNTDLTFNEHESHESHEYNNYSSNSCVPSVASDHRSSTYSTNNPSYSCDSCNSCSNNQLVVCVVESVRSCIVLSERFPKYLWMATGYLANLNEMVFLPLKGHHVVCFPATDPTGDTYLLWLSVATEARKYGIDITVSRFLEDHATPEQKEREIDLVDYLFF